MALAVADFFVFCREGDIDFEITSILTIFPEFLQ